MAGTASSTSTGIGISPCFGVGRIGGGGVDDFLLLESGDNILLETGDKIIL